MIFTHTFAKYEKLLHQKYEVSSTIRHRGERGRQREHGLLTFLRDNLPKAYGVATGEVIPYLGPTPSPQCDIIIYDHLRMPVLGAGDSVQQVPLEAVYGVIECKSLIDQKALDDTGRKIRAIRELSRCPSKRPLKKKMDPGPFYILFGYRLKSSSKQCTNFMAAESKNRDVDVIALNKGCGLWLEKIDRPIWLNTTEEKSGYHETLIFFFINLLERLRSVDLGEPSILEMFYSDK